MRKLTVAAFVSLDGVMQAPGGPEEDRSGGFAHGGWIVPYSDPVIGETVGRLFHAPVDLLLGRKTYDIFAPYWPQVKKPFADRINNMTKHVATRTPRPLEWANSHAIGPDAVAAVRDLKAQGGQDLMTQGSADLIQSLLRADLVDRLVLMTYPVLLGPGKRLFGEGVRPVGLTLTDSRTAGTGAIISTYEREGPVRTGSFALDPA